MFICGTTGNILAGIWLWRASSSKRNVRYFRTLYRLMNLIDGVVCVTLVPQVDVFLSPHRTPSLYSWSYLCEGWGLVWDLLPASVVFLKALLMVSRMLTVTRPFQPRNTRTTAGVLVLYYSLLLVSVTVQYGGGYAEVGYDKTDAACTLEPLPTDPAFLQTNLILFAIQLGLPVLPIIVCAAITFYTLVRASARARRARASAHIHVEATKTVIIVTVVYLTCNLPCFLNFIYYLKGLSGEKKPAFKDLYDTPFLRWYVWNLTYIFSVGLNATLDPLIFFIRMNKFRDFVIKNFKKAANGVLNYVLRMVY